MLLQTDRHYCFSVCAKANLHVLCPVCLFSKPRARAICKFNYKNIGKQLIVAQKSLRHCIHRAILCIFCVCYTACVLFPVERVFLPPTISAPPCRAFTCVCGAPNVLSSFFQYCIWHVANSPTAVHLSSTASIFSSRETYIFIFVDVLLFRRQKREIEKEVRSDFGGARAT